MLTPSQVENDLEADGGQNKANCAPASIGIIIPPTDIRSIVDTAAKFMASIEPRAEKRIIADNAGIRKYSFLYGADPYHAYYQQQVSELRAQNGSTPSADGNEKTGPFGLKGLTDKVRTSVTGMTTVSERMRETLKWYAFGERVAAAITVVSPITGELVPVHKMYQHMRICVTDPKYKEQKERLFAKIRETTLAQDDKIYVSIARLARTRADVFGTTEEEFSNAVKAEIERTDPVLDLDGHTATKAMSAEDRVTDLSGVPSLPPPPGLSSNLHPNDQYSTSSRPGINMMKRPMDQSMAVNLPPPGCQFIRLPQHGTPIVPPPPMPQGMPEETEPKRQRLDDSLLVPEDQFLAQHPGPVCISVWVPEKGRMLEISVKSSCESVSSLKEKIAGEIEVPANKQKLSGKAGFLKDNLSLAYYNVGGGEMLSLSWC